MCHLIELKEISGQENKCIKKRNHYLILFVFVAKKSDCPKYAQICHLVLIPYSCGLKKSLDPGLPIRVILIKKG